MITPELASLRTLVHERLDGDELARGALAKLLDPGAHSVDLGWSLRHHRDGAVRDRVELDFREGVDRLLALYALLEIGCYARALPEPMPPDVSAQALDVLTPSAVRLYYEEHYPVVLVRRFRSRISSGNAQQWVDERSAARARELYPVFLEIDRQVADDDDAQTFLWMLDDMRWHGVGLPDLIKTCRNPARFGEALAGADGAHPRVASGARGLVEYLAFAVRFDDLLRSSASVGALTEHFWLYYAYWLSHIGRRLKKHLDEILRVVGEWPLESRTGDTAELRAVIQRLITGPRAYGAPSARL